LNAAECRNPPIEAKAGRDELQIARHGLLFSGTEIGATEDELQVSPMK
jgi:hypothetical protein